jgi:zinc transporter ZupT
MITIQGLVNVLGLITGSVLIGQGNFIIAFFMSISAGTFLYISLAEVLSEQVKNMTKTKLNTIIVANIFLTGLVFF